MSAPENPAAFPEVPGDFNAYEGRAGMTLRDWFAGQMLAGATASPDSALTLPSDTCQSEVDAALAEHWGCVARVAYITADAMLIARAVSPPTKLEIKQAAPGNGEKLLSIARDFIDKHHVSCAEATGNDGVYEEAPLLVESLAEVVGYYSYPESGQ